MHGLESDGVQTVEVGYGPGFRGGQVVDGRTNGIRIGWQSVRGSDCAVADHVRLW